MLAATYSDRLLAFAQTCREEAAALDHRSALRAYVEGLIVHINVYRGLAASIGMVLQSGTPGCAAIGEVGAALLAQAQASGVVRADVSFDDLVYLITAVALAVENEGGSPAHIAHRVSLFSMACTAGSLSREPVEAHSATPAPWQRPRLRHLRNGAHGASAHPAESASSTIFDIVLLIYWRSIMEEPVKNVDVKVTVDVRVDPAGAALFLTSVAAAWYFLKRNVKRLP